MKKIFSFLTAILFAGSLMAETSTLNFTTSYASGGATADDDAEWTVTSDGTESNFDNTCGIHYGTNNASVTYLQLSTSDIEGTISQVVVNCRDAQATATVSVTVGGTNFTCSGSTTATKTSANYTFTGSASGEIVVRVDRRSSMKKALYVKSIEVTYTPASGPSLSTDVKTIDFGTVEQGDDVEDQEVEVTFANLTGSVTYAGLSTPFEAAGTISTTGDKITISANTETIGDYSQTLTVQSTADSKSATVTVKMKVKAPAHKYDITYDFSKINGFTTWSNSYTARDTSYTDADVKFASACRQTGTITDIPVTKGGDVELILTNTTKCISAAKFVCRQWTDKAQTITLTYSTDGGENYSAFDPAVESDEFEIEKLSLPTNVTALKISFSSTSNQVGIESVSFDLANKTPTALDNTNASVKAVKTIVNGQLLIEKNGRVYNAFGQTVK